MKSSLKSLDRYILKSFFPYFFAGFLFFSFLFILSYLRNTLQKALEKGIPILWIGELFFYTFSWVLSFILPMAVLFGVILSTSHLSQNIELIALRSLGVSYFRVFRPYFLIATLVALFSFFLQIHWVPFSFRQVAYLTQKILHYNPTLILEEGIFLKGDLPAKEIFYIFYIQKLQKKPEGIYLKNFYLRLIEKKKAHFSSQWILAGEALTPPKKEILILREGIYFHKEKENFSLLDFSHGHMEIFLPKKEVSINLSSSTTEALPLSVLWENYSKNEEYQKEFHKRLSLPLAGILLAFLGFPLGILSPRQGKSHSFGIAMGVLFGYYVLFILNLHLSPPYFLWSANLLCFIGGSILTLRWIRRW